MPDTLTLPTNTPTPTDAPQPTMSELVAGILTDAQTLVRQQAVMLRAELKEDIRRTSSAAQYMGVGAATAGLGGLFLAVALVHLLAWLVPSLPYWAAWAITGGLLVAGGLVAIYLGKAAFQRFNPLPDKTLNALQENVSWITTKRPS
jgi:Putative Actinobacterial Holin-X, holin superfamily III